MARLRVHAFSISIDGYGAGPRQSRAEPLGVGGEALHEWMFPTRTFLAMGKKGGGTTDVDDAFVRRGFDAIGAWILGRNMFGPIRGPWPDDAWKGWWGDDPPYHTPVYVLTHHPRKPVAMKGGTEFRFVGDIHQALQQAARAAGSQDIRLGGGASTIRQYLQAGLVDEMHVAIAPVVLGSGEHLLAGIDLPGLGYEVREFMPGSGATHVVVARKQPPRSDSGHRALTTR